LNLILCPFLPISFCIFAGPFSVLKLIFQNMQIVRSTTALQEVLKQWRDEGKQMGLVPTMGALHEGHLTLVRNSVAENDVTVVSVFVNPTQFNNKTDLEKYPRNLDRDAAMLEAVGCSLVFAPEVSDMYSQEELDSSFEFDFQGLDEVMEGKFRPGHFNGVVQVVSKLFRLVGPRKAYFGQKDFQQLAIIRHMTRVMGFDIEIVECAIVREASGLAMSSRNERLSSEQREIAASISKVLVECSTFVPERSPSELKNWVESQIDAIEGLRLEYFEIANSNTLQTAASWHEPTVGCIAVFCGDVRLIDVIKCS
jgi:pantoate--beta-alanine ligase